jgi:RNA polymerase sigma factor (sigma-70 family)
MASSELVERWFTVGIPTLLQATRYTMFAVQPRGGHSMNQLDPELLEIEPTSQALFRHDVLHQPKPYRWPRWQRDALIEQARAGDQEARELLICSCLWFVFHRAWRYKDIVRHDDPMDLVSVGNVAMVEALEKALWANDPFRYLMSQGAYAIAHYVYHENYMIKRDKHRNLVTPDVSLDAELQNGLIYGGMVGKPSEVDISSLYEEDSNTQEDEKYAPLYQALDRLTEKQRFVVMKHLGLGDYGAPESLADIGRSMGVNPDAAWKHWRAAKMRLKKLLGAGS